MNEVCVSAKQIPALAISLSLIWALMGCLSVCAAHLEDERDDYSSHSLAVSFTDLDEDCCPINRTSVEIQERQFFKPGRGLCSFPPQFPAKEELSLGMNIVDPSPAHSPPFEQLCTLRI